MQVAIFFWGATRDTIGLLLATTAIIVGGGVSKTTEESLRAGVGRVFLKQTGPSPFVEDSGALVLVLDRAVFWRKVRVRAFSGLFRAVLRAHAQLGKGVRFSSPEKHGEMVSETGLLPGGFWVCAEHGRFAKENA